MELWRHGSNVTNMITQAHSYNKYKSHYKKFVIYVQIIIVYGFLSIYKFSITHRFIYGFITYGSRLYVITYISRFVCNCYIIFINIIIFILKLLLIFILLFMILLLLLTFFCFFNYFKR